MFKNAHKRRVYYSGKEVAQIEGSLEEAVKLVIAKRVEQLIRDDIEEIAKESCRIVAQNLKDVSIFGKLKNFEEDSVENTCIDFTVTIKKEAP